MTRAPEGYGTSVFINASFSADRRPLFDAIVFAIQADAIGLAADDLTFKERVYLTSRWLKRRSA